MVNEFGRMSLKININKSKMLKVKRGHRDKRETEETGRGSEILTFREILTLILSRKKGLIGRMREGKYGRLWESCGRITRFFYK